MIDAAVFLRQPIHFKQNVYVYPPSINEVMREPLFGAFTEILLYTAEDIEDLYQEKKLEGTPPTPWQFFIFTAMQSIQNRAMLGAGLKFFTHQDCYIIPEKETIMIGNIKETLQSKDLSKTFLLKESDWFDFQNLIRYIIGEKKAIPPDPNLHPKIRAMKAKARLRDRIKRKKGGGLNLFSSLVALCCMDIGLSPLNVGEIGYASVGPLIEMYQQKEKYETDIRSIQAGADPKKIKPKYWMKNLED